MTTVDILTHINILYFVSNVSAENSLSQRKIVYTLSPVISRNNCCLCGRDQHSFHSRHI